MALSSGDRSSMILIFTGFPLVAGSERTVGGKRRLFRRPETPIRTQFTPVVVARVRVLPDRYDTRVRSRVSVRSLSHPSLDAINSSGSCDSCRCSMMRSRGDEKERDETLPLSRHGPRGRCRHERSASNFRRQRSESLDLWFMDLETRSEQECETTRAARECADVIASGKEPCGRSRTYPGHHEPNTMKGFSDGFIHLLQAACPDTSVSLA